MKWSIVLAMALLRLLECSLALAAPGDKYSEMVRLVKSGPAAWRREEDSAAPAPGAGDLKKLYESRIAVIINASSNLYKGITPDE